MKPIGIDTDGCVICFDPEATPDQVYNCGETPEEFGLTDEEKAEFQGIKILKILIVDGEPVLVLE